MAAFTSRTMHNPTPRARLFDLATCIDLVRRSGSGDEREMGTRGS
jgi:hypothetical protein